MAKYKGKVAAVTPKQQEESTSSIPAGTWYLNVLFKLEQKWITDYNTWEPVNTLEDLLVSKRYYLSHDIMKQTQQHGTRSLYQISRYFMNQDLGFPEDAKDDALEGLIGLEREIITEENGDYLNIKYINDPNRRKSLVDPVKKEEFASIFNR